MDERVVTTERQRKSAWASTGSPVPPPLPARAPTSPAARGPVWSGPVATGQLALLLFTFSLFAILHWSRLDWSRQFSTAARGIGTSLGLLVGILVLARAWMLTLTRSWYKERAWARWGYVILITTGLLLQASQVAAGRGSSRGDAGHGSAEAPSALPTPAAPPRALEPDAAAPPTAELRDEIVALRQEVLHLRRFAEQTVDYLEVVQNALELHDEVRIANDHYFDYLNSRLTAIQHDNLASVYGLRAAMLANLGNDTWRSEELRRREKAQAEANATFERVRKHIDAYKEAYASWQSRKRQNDLRMWVRPQLGE